MPANALAGVQGSMPHWSSLAADPPGVCGAVSGGEAVLHTWMDGMASRGSRRARFLGGRQGVLFCRMLSCLLSFVRQVAGVRKAAGSFLATPVCNCLYVAHLVSGLAKSLAQWTMLFSI